MAVQIQQVVNCLGVQLWRILELEAVVNELSQPTKPVEKVEEQKDGSNS